MPLIFRILEHPCFAALLVGTLINLATWTPLWGLTTQVQFSAKWHHLNDFPLYFWVTFLIPYLVPFVMMSLSRRLTLKKMRQLMRQFPEMNPDMVMRLKPDLSQEYLNPAGKRILQRLSLLEQLTLAECSKTSPSSPRPCIASRWKAGKFTPSSNTHWTRWPVLRKPMTKTPATTFCA